MWHMRKSATKGNKKKACEKLLAEYNRLKDRKDLKVLSKIKDHTFENTCPLLANYYKVLPFFFIYITMINLECLRKHYPIYNFVFIKVNIVIHSMDSIHYGHGDLVIYIQSGRPQKYDHTRPRVDLMWCRTDLGIGHAYVLSPERATYGALHGL